MSDNIQVVVRCRARNDKEVAARSPAILELPDPVYAGGTSYIHVNLNSDSNSHNSTYSHGSGSQKGQKRFKVDQVYGPGADQALLFENVAAPLFLDFLQGSNVTILAYGQTGLGKTHTMCGDMSGDSSGIIPRVLSRLFAELVGSDYMVKMSCIELYKEELRDLIDDDLSLASVRAKLRLVPDLGRDSAAAAPPKIQNLCELPIDTADMALRVVERCLGKRRVGATKLNDFSSRSHTILSINLYKEVTSSSGNSQYRVSRMNLVDLAGSEDINKSGAVNERAREAGSINQSLLALGKVINCLSEGKDPKHVPYRESKLTRLLQGLLGGKTKTALIATVSPAQINISETLSTLNYALKAKNIKNIPQSIHDSETMLKRVLVSDLSAQVARLTRDMLASKDKEDFVRISQENYTEYTSNVNHLQSHLDEKNTRVLSLELALDTKNAEIGSLKSQLTNVERRIVDFTAEMATKDKEIMRLNQNFFKLQEKHLRQNQKLGQIMENNIADINQNLKNMITGIASNRDKISHSLESSKRKLIDDLISSQTKLAHGIEELQKLLDIRDFTNSVVENNFDVSLFRQEFDKYDVASEFHHLGSAQGKLRQDTGDLLRAEAHQPLVDEFVRQSHDEANIAKQRLLSEITGTIETMFSAHQGKFERALGQIALNVLNSTEDKLVTKFDEFDRETRIVTEKIEDKTAHLKRNISALEEGFDTNKAMVRDQIVTMVEQRLSKGVTALTGTALSETDGAENGILQTFERLSHEISHSGESFQGNIVAASADLSNFAQTLSTISPGQASPERPGQLAVRLVNTLGSPKEKKRKFSPMKVEEKLQHSRIPQLSPVIKR